MLKSDRYCKFDILITAKIEPEYEGEFMRRQKWIGGNAFISFRTILMNHYDQMKLFQEITFLAADFETDPTQSSVFLFSFTIVDRRTIATNAMIPPKPNATVPPNPGYFILK